VKEGTAQQDLLWSCFYIYSGCQNAFAGLISKLHFLAKFLGRPHVKIHLAAAAAAARAASTVATKPAVTAIASA
jgi:hypothetical protein